MGKTASTLVRTLLSAALSALVALGATAYAQERPANRVATPPAADTRTARPNWSELSPKQQAVLAPLAADWESLDSTRRKKWVTIANRYPRMGTEEQTRLQERMQAWAKLTPQQRRVARENYRALRQLPSPQRSSVREQWQQRQTSSPSSGSAAESKPDTTGNTKDSAAK